MTLQILYAGRPDHWDIYREMLARAFNECGLDFDLTNVPNDPARFDYVVYSPNGPVSDFSPFKNTKAVLSLWAGVETIVTNKTLTQPLCRMVDPGLTQGMIDYIVGNTLRYHLNVDGHLQNQDGIWRNTSAVPPVAQERTVGVLGLGALGQACARALSNLGFDTLGWSRRPKELAGVTTFSGPVGLTEMLSRTEICAVLLPLTDDTTHVMNKKTLSAAKPGMRIINAGRGPLIDDTALLAALNSGHIAHATLDVFDVEPLPVDHAYWAHPNVTVTPHIAAETRPRTASQAVAQNIARSEAGEPLLHVVDRETGY